MSSLFKQFVRAVVPQPARAFVYYMRRFARAFGIVRGWSAYLKIKTSRTGRISIRIPQSRGEVFLRVGSTDFLSFEQVFLLGNYEFEPDNNVKFIIDAGANVGYMTLLFADRFPSARIFALEPEPGNFELLKANTASNPNILPIHGALWSKKTFLKVTNPGAEEWAFQMKEVGSSEGGIQAFTIQDLLERSKSPSIDILKMDIEGAEKEVFSGNVDWLARVDRMVVEIHTRISPDCEAPFRAAVEKHPFIYEKKGADVFLRRQASLTNGEGISIVIRTSNSEESLRTLFQHLKITSHDEIIVVDTGSTDGTIALAENAGARIIRNDRRFNYSHTLNLGFRVTKNRWVLVLSSHCYPADPDFLECYRRTIAQLPEPPALTYGLRVLSKRHYARLNKTVRVHAKGHMQGDFAWTGNQNALYDRHQWEKHAFDENVPTGEDTEWRDWALNAGLTCVEVPAAAVFYRHLSGPVYRYRKSYNEMLTIRGNMGPQTWYEMAVDILHVTRHLLWEERALRSWIGQLAAILGAFVASRQKIDGRKI